MFTSSRLSLTVFLQRCKRYIVIFQQHNKNLSALGAEGRVFESCRPDHYLAGFSVPVFAIVFAVLVSEAFSQRRLALLHSSPRIKRQEDKIVALPSLSPKPFFFMVVAIMSAVAGGTNHRAAATQSFDGLFAIDAWK